MNGLPHFHDQHNHLGVPGIVVDESRCYDGAINGSGHRYLGQQQTPPQHTPYNYAPNNNAVAFGNTLSQNNSAQNSFDMKMLADIQQQRHHHQQQQQQHNNHLQMMMNTNQLQANSRGGGVPLQHQDDIQLSHPQDAGNLNYQQQNNFQSSNLANFLAQLQRQQDGQQGGGAMNAPQHQNHQPPGQLDGQQVQSQMPTMNMNPTFANAHQNHAQMGDQNLLNNNHTLMQTMLRPVPSAPQPMHQIDAGMMSHQRQQVPIAGMQQRRNSASNQRQPGGFSSSDQLRRQSGFAKGNGVHRAADTLPSQSKQLEERLKKFQTLQQLAAPSEKSFQPPKMAEVPGLVSISNNSKLPITTNNVKLSCAEEKPTVPLAAQPSHVVRSTHDPSSEAVVRINDLIQQSTRQNKQVAQSDNGVRGSKAGTIKEIQIDLPSRRKINFHIIKIIERMRPEAIMHDKLPLLVQKIEEHLYSFAESKDGFTCHDTLKERLNNLALQTGMSKAESQVLANLLAGEAITFRDVPATLSSGYGRTAAPKPSSRTTVDLTGLFADSPRDNTKDTSSPQKFGNKDQRPHQHDDCRHDPLLPKSPKVANKIQPHTGAEEAKAALKGSTMSISTDSKLQMSPSAVQQDLTKKQAALSEAKSFNEHVEQTRPSIHIQMGQTGELRKRPSTEAPGLQSSDCTRPTKTARHESASADAGDTSTDQEKQAGKESANQQWMIDKYFPLVRKMIEHENGWLFKDAVDPVELGLVDYFDVIETPMDLSLVEKKLKQGCYKSEAMFESDVKLVFNNAIVFNGEESDVGVIAKEMLGLFSSHFKNLIST